MISCLPHSWTLKRTSWFSETSGSLKTTWHYYNSEDCTLHIHIASVTITLGVSPSFSTMLWFGWDNFLSPQVLRPLLGPLCGPIMLGPSKTLITMKESKYLKYWSPLTKSIITLRVTLIYSEWGFLAFPSLSQTMKTSFQTLSNYHKSVIPQINALQSVILKISQINLLKSHWMDWHNPTFR
jgi:hypothetical protein